MTGLFEIINPGWATTIQDRGRPGFGAIGVSSSGVVDQQLAALLNRLVGNSEDAALLETCGGLTIRAVTALLIASSSEHAPISINAGETYTLQASNDYLWHYLAFRGGIDTVEVMGSRSTDTMSGLGGTLIAAGIHLSCGQFGVNPITTDVAAVRPLASVARVTVGPRSDWFVGDWDMVLGACEWRVTNSSRVGVRLSGSAILRRFDSELPSEAMVRGAIQVPPDGDPVMLLADYPTTGGYPVIAVVHPDDVAVVAQHRPGSTLRLRPIFR